MVYVDEDRAIKISDKILLLIKAHIQDDYSKSESGGVLIARENISNNNFVIEHITTPFTGDIQSRLRYTRKDKQHVKVFQTLHQENAGIYFYIGEWHTHPEQIPNYSSIDEKNWKRIAKESAGANIFYHLIAGTIAFRMWKYERSFRTPRLIMTQSWKEFDTARERDHI